MPYFAHPGLQFLQWIHPLPKEFSWGERKQPGKKKKKKTLDEASPGSAEKMEAGPADQLCGRRQQYRNVLRGRELYIFEMACELAPR
jgi:hypothetical protein